MSIDRAARARRRRARRAASERGRRDKPWYGSASMELDSFLNPARKHQLEQLNRIEVAREDVREAGDEPIDLDAGVARLTRRMQDSGSAGGPAD